MLTVSVCIGSACHLKGSYNVISAFQQMLETHGLTDQVELKAVFCLGHCTQAVSVMVGENGPVYSVSGATAQEFFESTILPLVAA